MHSRLINQYINIFDAMQLDDLNDILVENFHFRNPKVEVFGRANYIIYAKECYGIFASETVQLVKHSETEYTHEYYVSLFDVSWKILDKIHVYEDIKIEDGLIAKVESRYDMESISEVTRRSIVVAMEKYGKALT